MAGERTERATPRRRQKAREEGQVAKSKDLGNAITLFFGMILLNFMIGMIVVKLKGLVYESLSLQQGYNLTIENIIPMLMHFVFSNMIIIAPIIVIMAVLGVATSVMQTGFMFTPKAIQPKLDAINPIKGFQKFFKLRILIDLTRNLLNMAVIGFVSYLVIRGEWDNLLKLSYMQIDFAVITIGKIIFKLGLTISIIMIVIGVADFIYQKFEFEKSIKMSKQEVKQEYKDIEGDPQIVGKRKERMRQMAMNRMMQAVPKADVIITNPTHIAVAIQYDLESMEAPLVLAMGEDTVALKIREVAKEHNIEIVENKPLARALYETAEIGQIIPVDLYQAVAEVLAFVFKLEKRKI